MPETIETEVGRVFPESDQESAVDEQTDTAGPPLTLAAEREALLARLDEISRLEAQQTEAARQAAQAEAAPESSPTTKPSVEEPNLLAQQFEAETASLPIPKFAPDTEQIQQLEQMYQAETTVGTKEKLLALLAPWKKKEATVDQETNLKGFQDFVQSLPSQAQKEGLATYLASVFESPQEAASLLKGQHKYEGRRWQKGFLEFSDLKHVQMDTPQPAGGTETGADRAAWKTAREAKARLRLHDIWIKMLDVHEATGIEPPLDLLRDQVATDASGEETTGLAA